MINKILSRKGSANLTKNMLGRIFVPEVQINFKSVRND
jgi:hypothetical protein